MGLNMAQYAASETVMLTDAVLASDIDAGREPIHLQCLAGFLHRQPGTALPGPSVFQHPQRQAESCRLHQHRRDLRPVHAAPMPCTYADGTTSFPLDLSGDHNWIKYVATGWIPAGAREAVVFLTRSPNAGMDQALPDTYVDLVKLDVTGANAPRRPHQPDRRRGQQCHFLRQRSSALVSLTSGSIMRRTFRAKPIRRWFCRPSKWLTPAPTTSWCNGTITSDTATLTVVRPPVFAHGQWDFLGGNLAATSGADQQFFDSGVASDHGFRDYHALWHPGHQRRATSVMHFTPTPLRNGRLHAVSWRRPTPVNAYTLIYDVYYPAGSDLTWRTLWSLDVSTKGSSTAPTTGRPAL